MRLVVSGTGTTGQVTVFSDVDNGTLSIDSDDTASISFSGINTPSNGFVRGTVTAGANPARNMQCAVAVVDSKTVMGCIGQDPGDDTKMYNLIAVEN